MHDVTRGRTTVGVSLPNEQHKALIELAIKHKISMSMFLRSIITDALIDEGYSFVQRSGTPGRPTSGEASKASGAVTS